MNRDPVIPPENREGRGPGASLPRAADAESSPPNAGTMPNVPMRPPATGIRRWLWIALAYVSLGLGIAAAFIPGIPSTEFILLSAWAASRGSPKLQAWLLRHRVFGPMIHNWHNGKRVARRAKIAASISMTIAAAIMFLSFPDHRWWVSLAVVGMAGGALWMWSRPEPPTRP